MKNKMKFVVVVMAITAIFGCSVPESAGRKGNEKWESIFDGKTLNGWIQRGGKARYHVEASSIVGTTADRNHNTFLCTEKMYSDFVLEMDFKVDMGLNSGVQIRSNSFKEYKNGRVHGYQVEIDSSRKPYAKEPRNLLANGKVAPDSEPRSWTGGIYDEARRGWLNKLTKNEKARRAFKSNEWNHFRIEAIGNSIKTWLNGVLAADLVDSMTSTGFIGLQVHSTKSEKPLQVRWRNIRIQNLSK